MKIRISLVNEDHNDVCRSKGENNGCSVIRPHFILNDISCRIVDSCVESFTCELLNFESITISCYDPQSSSLC